MTCSLLWVRCLFCQFSISDFGGNWPLKWKSSKLSFRILRRDTELRFMTKFGENRPLRCCQKVLWITTKKLWLCRTRPSPHLAQNGPIAPKNSLNVVTPWHVNVYRIWSGSAALCRTSAMMKTDAGTCASLSVSLLTTSSSFLINFYYILRSISGSSNISSPIKHYILISPKFIQPFFKYCNQGKN